MKEVTDRGDYKNQREQMAAWLGAQNTWAKQSLTHTDDVAISNLNLIN